MKYDKPKVVVRGYTPEPVEAGCCLRSCGGSPGGLQAGHYLTKQAEEIIVLLKRARK